MKRLVYRKKNKIKNEVETENVHNEKKFDTGDINTKRS